MSITESDEAAHDRLLQIRVLFFGAAREATGGRDEIVLRLNAPATTANALADLLERYPQLARFGRSLLCAVNCEYTAPEATLADGDELALFPPVSGGDDDDTDKDHGSIRAPDAGVITNSFPDDFFELTTMPIDVGEVARRVVRRDCGATVTLDGYARETTAARPATLYLEYEAYAPMALAEMARLGERAHALYPQIAYIGIVHRTGRTEIGETSVVISVGAPHRGVAFAACEWAIRELKRVVPIWKKEFYAGGEVWVEGETHS